MATKEEWAHAAWHFVSQAVRRRVWRLGHHEQADAEWLADQLWGEDPPAPRFGAVIDILGFSAFMRRHPSHAHVQLQQLGQRVASAIRSHGRNAVAAAVFSDGAYLDSDEISALAEVAMQVLFLGLVHTPTMLVHGLVARGDYRLVFGAHGAGAGAVPQVHWAGQGVLEIGLKEKLLPKGAMIFVDPSAEDAVRAAGLPTAASRLLWSERNALDWTGDPIRGGLLNAAWGNVSMRPHYIAHVAATRRWLRRIGEARGVALR